MELFEQIRREYEHGVGTIKGVAQKFGRAPADGARGDRQCGSKTAEGGAKREKAKMAPVIPWIDEILEADQKAPRKQRHTAHRIWMPPEGGACRRWMWRSQRYGSTCETEDRVGSGCTGRCSFRKPTTGAGRPGGLV